jgi:RHS repeat-associated protein
MSRESFVAESDLSGNLTSEYVFFDGERVARKDFPGGAVSYYFSDHLKTTDIVTDAQGNIKNESDFYPWGGELQFSANDSNHYKFTGKERDSETGLDYFGARYYSNGLGRFITPDWAAKVATVPYADLSDPQSLNLYSYVRNRPTVMRDEDGHDGTCGFFCKLGNFFKYGHFVDDDHLEAALQKDAQKAITDLTKRGVIINGKSPADALKGKTNQQIVDAYQNINSQLDLQQALNQAAVTIPVSAINTLNSIDNTGAAPKGQQGGNQFMNDGRGGGGVLPKTDANGNPITYREWDVNPKPASGTRGTERLVTGSDGSAYYTDDHYQTFTRIR